MHIPASKRHKACFSFNNLPHAPTTKEPMDVVLFLNKLFIPDEFVSLLHEKTLEYIQSKNWKHVWKITKGDILQFFVILYYMGYCKLPSKEDY